MNAIAEKLSEALEEHGLPPLSRNSTALEFLRRPEVSYESLNLLGFGNPLTIDLNVMRVRWNELIREIGGIII